MNFYRSRNIETNLCILCSFYADTWDCIATCFFIDTAHNVIDYIDTIWKILKPGGIWINVGKCDQPLFLLALTYVWSHNRHLVVKKSCGDECVCAKNSVELETSRAWTLSQVCSEYVQMFASYNQVNTMWFLNREVHLPSGRFCIHASNIYYFTNVVSCILFFLFL